MVITTFGSAAADSTHVTRSKLCILITFAFCFLPFAFSSSGYPNFIGMSRSLCPAASKIAGSHPFRQQLAYRMIAASVCKFASLRIDWNRVPRTRVVLYQEEDGSCPFLEWFAGLPAKVQDKYYIRLERLREMGHELRRPEADFLCDGIYELRVSLQGVHHRILYFFHGAVTAVVSHGVVKERAVPPKEIDRAVERKKRFAANPERHTYQEV